MKIDLHIIADIADAKKLLSICESFEADLDEDERKILTNFTDALLEAIEDAE